MALPVGTAQRIFDDHGVVVPVGGATDGGFDAALGVDAQDHHRLDTAGLQHPLQVGIEEGVGPRLLDHRVVGAGLQAIDEVPAEGAGKGIVRVLAVAGLEAQPGG